MAYTKEDMIEQYGRAFKPYAERKNLPDFVAENWKKHFKRLKNFNEEDFNNVVKKHK